MCGCVWHGVMREVSEFTAGRVGVGRGNSGVLQCRGVSGLMNGGWYGVRRGRGKMSEVRGVWDSMGGGGLESSDFSES